MASLAATPVQIDPLQELQKVFCLFKLSSTIWVADRQEIAAVRKGTLATAVSMYRQGDGKLLMQRFLETLAVPSDLKRVIGNFMLSPHTTVYDAVAFSPLPTPSSTLNYWSGSPVYPEQGDWSCIQTFLQAVICNGDAGLYQYLISVPRQHQWHRFEVVN